jgi:hypothetical protein
LGGECGVVGDFVQGDEFLVRGSDLEGTEVIGRRGGRREVAKGGVDDVQGSEDEESADDVFSEVEVI